jgi:hypothetical protein
MLTRGTGFRLMGVYFCWFCWFWLPLPLPLPGTVKAYVRQGLASFLLFPFCMQHTCKQRTLVLAQFKAAPAGWILTFPGFFLMSRDGAWHVDIQVARPGVSVVLLTRHVAASSLPRAVAAGLRTLAWLTRPAFGGLGCVASVPFYLGWLYYFILTAVELIHHQHQLHASASLIATTNERHSLGEYRCGRTLIKGKRRDIWGINTGSKRPR